MPSDTASREALIYLEGSCHQVSIKDGQTILEAALGAGLEPPYSCEAGVCGACKATCNSGSVRMHATMALDPDEIEQGRILTCQAVPTTAQVEIHYE